jgi:hypothetical protein
MPKYQIRFCDKDGNGSFCYVECTAKEAPQKAADKATEEINKRKNKTGLFVAPYKAPRRLNVWEWDTEKKEVKKKGHRFKLQLIFVEATYNSGRKVRDEWYEPVDNTTEVVKSKTNK